MQFIQKLTALLKTLFGIEEQLRPVITGFIKAEKDLRDHVYTGEGPTSTVKPEFGATYGTGANLGVSNLPTSVDLALKMGAVEDQLSINSCVGHATTSAFEALTGMSDRSRLFAYYNARAVANQQGSDAGTTVRNALRAISINSLSAEVLWPYDISQVTVKPSSAAFSDAAPNKSKIASYATITSFDTFKTALSNGLPVIFGFNVPASFRTTTKTTGVQQLLQPGEQVIGGHCVLAVGYNDDTQMVKVRNSFGTAWGKGGYFYMPYSWFKGSPFTSLILDPWVMVPAK